MTESQTKPEAIIYVSGCLTVEILGVEYGIDDYAKFRWGNDGHITRSMIRQDENGDDYFISFNNKLYFKDAVRIT